MSSRAHTTREARHPSFGAGRRLTYLCLQPMRDGQASATHVAGIVEGLRRIGWTVSLVTTPRLAGRGIPGRALASGLATIRCMRYLPTSDVVYVRWHPGALPSVLVAKALRRRVVVEVNGTDEDWVAAWPAIQPLSRLLAWSGVAQLRLADGVIAVTRGLANWVTSVSSNRATTVIANGVDVDRFTGVADPSERPYVAFVGALAPWQGVETMLEAVDHRAWSPGVDLVIAGEGPMRQACERATRRSHVRYLGRIPSVEVPSLMERSLATLCVQTPTSGRGTVGCSPIKLFEGMAAARPVIVSDLPGVADPVRAARCGVVIAPGDAEQLARAVSRLTADERLADEMGRRGRRAAEREHSWSARAAATSAFIEGLQT